MGQHGWGTTSEKDLIDAVHAALDNGIRLFDTSDIYGLGVSEEILGKALMGKRSQAIIATKFGVRRENNKTFYDNSSEWIKKAVDASLNRLNTDYIDLYQLHYWDNKTPFNEIIATLSELRGAGKIRAFGVTNFDLLAYGVKQPIKGLASFSFEYSLANRTHEKTIVDICDKLNLLFLSWGSLGQGILSGKYGEKKGFSEDDRRSKKEYVNFHGDKLAKNLRYVEYMKDILPSYGDKSVAQIAIRWILDQIPKAVILVGIKNQYQLMGNLGALNWKLAEEHHARLSSISSL